MKREVAVRLAVRGIFVEYVRFQTGRKQSGRPRLCHREHGRSVDLRLTDYPAFIRVRLIHPAQCEKHRPPKSNKEATKMAANEKLRVRLKSYDHTLVDAAAAKVVEIAKRNGNAVSGPIPLPTDKEIITILRAVHKYKDSREQFEMRTHKRLIDIVNPSQKAIEALMTIELPAGVEIEIKA